MTVVCQASEVQIYFAKCTEKQTVRCVQVREHLHCDCLTAEGYTSVERFRQRNNSKLMSHRASRAI